MNGYNIFGEWTETDRLTQVLNIDHEGYEVKVDPLQTSWLLVGLEQVTRAKTLQDI